MNNDTKSGATSLACHTTMWILVIASLLGNLLVLVWRCSRKESRHGLISVLIISLAFADLLFCCHFLLQEVMLANVVFAETHQKNLTIHVTTVDQRLCLTVLFLVSVSCNAIMLTAVAIALATVFSFHLQRYGTRLITYFLVTSWISCLAFGGLVMWKRPIYHAMTKPTLDVDIFSLFVVYECTSSVPDVNWNPFPIIVTTINAMGSVVVTVLYMYLWCMVRKHRVSFTQSGSQEITHCRIRLTIIAGLNLLCWWPACFLYWFASVENVSVFHGTLSPVASLSMRVISVAVSVANPMIYTIASKRFLTVTRRACAGFFCRHRDEERLPIVPSLHATHGEVDGWASFCCRLCPCQRPPDTGILVCHPKSVTENTEEASLFSESD